MTQKHKKTNKQLKDNFDEVWEAVNHLFTYASDYIPENYLMKLRDLKCEISNEISIIEKDNE